MSCRGGPGCEFRKSWSRFSLPLSFPSCSREATFQEGVETLVGGRSPSGRPPGSATTVRWVGRHAHPRKPRMTDEPKPSGPHEAESPKRLSEQGLHAIESALLDLRRTIAAGGVFQARAGLPRAA